MAFTADIVKETSTTTGTGTLSLDGAVSGFLGFVATIGTGNQCYYAIAHRTAAEREVGIGTVTDGTPDTLSRTTVLSSTNGGALVNFSAGTKDVFVTIPAAKLPLLDTANSFTANQTIANTAPKLTLSDTTASAKDLDIVVDGNFAELRESAGASGSLLVLDLANNYVGLGTATPGKNPTAGRTYLTLQGNATNRGGVIQLGSFDAAATNNGNIEWFDVGNTSSSSLRNAYIASGSSGSAANNLGSYLTLATKEDGVSGGGVDRIHINHLGQVGVGMIPTQQFELSGSVGQKASGTTWSNPSDARLKDDVRDYMDGLDVIRKIRPVHYTLNGLGGTPKGTKGISVIAQEMLEVMPYTIETYKAKLRPEDTEETELYRFEASAVTFALVNAVKELAAEVEALKAGRL